MKNIVKLIEEVRLAELKVIKVKTHPYLSQLDEVKNQNNKISY